MVSRRVLLVLVAAATVLLVVVALLSPLALLVDGMGDAQGAGWLRGATVVCLVLFAVDFVCLVLALGIRAAETADEDSPTPKS